MRLMESLRGGGSGGGRGGGLGSPPLMYADECRYWPAAALYMPDVLPITNAKALHSAIDCTSKPGAQTLACVPPQRAVVTTCAHSSIGAYGGSAGGGRGGDGGYGTT